MSNFLDNLASRSLGLVPVVQPRLASRYEPPPAAARFPTFAPAEAERGVKGETTQARPEARQTETRVVEQRLAVPIQSPDAPREDRAERERQSAPPPRQSPPPGPAAAARAPVRPIETRPQSSQTNPAAASPRESASPSAEAARTRETIRNNTPRGEDDAALENRIRRLMALRLNAGEGNEAAGGATIAQAPARGGRESEESPETTQTIRVTINRIDVRAVTAPAAQEPLRAPARPAPQLSLADYLKQRGGGRR